MPKYVLTGVGGRIGSIAASYALEIDPPDSTLVFTCSNPDKISKDTRGKCLRAVFAGAEAVTLISTWAFGRRHQQAQNVIDAAKECGVRRICYTSFVGADDPAPVDEMPFLPRDHKQTKALICASGLEYNIQRNDLYVENIPNFFAPSWIFCDNRWVSNSGGAPGAYVAREDCGRVLAAILLGRGEPNKIYDVTGPEAITDEDVFQWISSNFKSQGNFVTVSDQEMKEYWLERGLPTDVSGGFLSNPDEALY
ncbi:hypothetical protein N7481_002012 [Penicillium waksmanii]|uniref:uncharacterized protein n=1 Tax=Penicillium waksmanii TaxID=69791 RepID=UPI0025475A72|nr:uncharacterized protein N7481_002012 [Penicillium waksmanii]KAJ5995035.1 hypothetical protein N7481_002012 [Penicillium waksmanii]